MDEEKEIIKAKEEPKLVAKPKPLKVALDPEAIASRERAHAIKVAESIAGGR